MSVENHQLHFQFQHESRLRNFSQTTFLIRFCCAVLSKEDSVVVLFFFLCRNVISARQLSCVP